MEGKVFLRPDSGAVMVVPDERFVHPVSRRLIFRFSFPQSIAGLEIIDAYAAPKEHAQRLVDGRGKEVGHPVRRHSRLGRVASTFLLSWPLGTEPPRIKILLRPHSESAGVL
jgi:hypothetical protein